MSSAMAAETDKETEDLKAVPLKKDFTGSELVIGLVGAVGTELDKVAEILEDRLKIFGYQPQIISISRGIILPIAKEQERKFASEYERISHLMDLGNDARRRSKDESILALGCAKWISNQRDTEGGLPAYSPRKAFIIKSLKHPAEVVRLREVYPHGFYLVGVHASMENRLKYLKEDKDLSTDQAKELMQRDEHEITPGGQRVRDTFHLSDVFVHIDGHTDKLKSSLWRFLMILFSHPYITPTFDEFAMYFAFSASLRSADLARQVGAIIARNQEIISTGANDCPKYGGGLYWPEYNEEKRAVTDKPNGRDYKRGCDPNVIERNKIIDEILESMKGKKIDLKDAREVLKKCRIHDLTEYGRLVHAEMEALLCCARNGISVRGATLYSTTFPCHNCARHIVAAGIERVVYVEPYPKSQAPKLHDDSINIGLDLRSGVVNFEPFVGIGPRSFFELFSMSLGSGIPIRRKDDETGETLKWEPKNARLRLQMRPSSYLDLESAASYIFEDFMKGEPKGNV